MNITDKIDTVTLDIPLFIRLLEYAKEDAKTDMDLHNLAQNTIELSKQQRVLNMKNYDTIVNQKKISETTSIGSALGSSSDPTSGFFIGPLGGIPTKVLKRRLYFKDRSVKNGDGTTSKIVEPPQGYVKEHIYTNEGELVTEGKLNEWFGQNMKQKPSFNGGKLVMIEPKCLAFPYCSQGAVDKPIKLIGETKEEMCESCYEYCSKIGEIAGKKPEQIAKIIREKYLSL